MSAYTATVTGNWSTPTHWVFTGTGTLTCSTSSAAVVGVGTAFTTQLAAGYSLFHAGAIGTVSSVADDTHLTLTGNAAQTLSGSAYNGQGSVPGSGDTVIGIGTGVTVTVDVSTVIGTGTGTAIAVYPSGAGGTTQSPLIIAAPLEVKGSLVVGPLANSDNVTITINAGQGISFNGNSGVTPVFNLTASGSSSSFFFLVVNGTSGSHCYINTKVGTAGNNALLKGNDSSQFTSPRINYCDFARLGTNTSVAGITFQPSGANIFITNCTLDVCSLSLAQTALGAAQTTNFNYNSFSGSLTFAGQISQICCSLGCTTYGSGAVFNVIGCGFDKTMEPNLGSGTQMVLADLAFGQLPYLASYGGNGTNSRWLVVDHTCTGTNYSGTLFTDIYYLTTLYVVNPHGLIMNANCTYDGHVTDPLFGTTNATTDGDQNFVANGVTIKNCLCLPAAAGTHAGMAAYEEFPHCEGSETGLTILYNTIVSPSLGETYMGEGGTVAGANFSAWKANLTTATNFFQIIVTPASAPVSASNGDYNGRKSSGGTPYTSYNPGCGAHDVSGQDPLFFDSTRNFLTYSRTVLGYSTGNATNDAASGIAYMVANPLQVDVMTKWVKNGYRPTNPAFKAASYPGDPRTVDSAGNAFLGASPDIGAMAWQAAATTQTGGACLAAGM